MQKFIAIECRIYLMNGMRNEGLKTKWTLPISPVVRKNSILKYGNNQYIECVTNLFSDEFHSLVVKIFNVRTLYYLKSNNHFIENYFIH